MNVVLCQSQGLSSKLQIKKRQHFCSLTAFYSWTSCTFCSFCSLLSFSSIHPLPLCDALLFLTFKKIASHQHLFYSLHFEIIYIYIYPSSGHFYPNLLTNMSETTKPFIRGYISVKYSRVLSLKISLAFFSQRVRSEVLKWCERTSKAIRSRC